MQRTSVRVNLAALYQGFIATAVHAFTRGHKRMARGPSMMMPGAGSPIAGPHRLDASSSQLDKAGASIPPRRSVHQRRRLIGY